MSDADVRRFIFDAALTTGRVPLRDEIGDRAAMQRLADAHIVVLDASGEIRMAMPFSAVPTPFLVRSGDYSAFGNCIWDALGILAMKEADGVVEASCGCCGDAMPLRVRGGVLEDTTGVVHYAIPARRWWDDICFT